MQTFTAVLLLAACVAASGSNLSNGRKLSEDAQSETFFGFGTAPKPTWTQVHQTLFGFNADGSPAMAPAPAMNKGAHDETFFGFGTAPKPTWSQVHQGIFGFNADGSPMMPPAMAPAAAGKIAPAAKPAPAAKMGRRLLQGSAGAETFFPTGGPYYSGTAPKPSMGDMHKAIFGFNDQASSETFFQGTIPKPSALDVHRAIFGFNSDNSKAVPEALAEGAKAPAPATGRKLLQAHDETFFGFGTAPKPTWSQVHQSIFGFNADGSPMMSPAMAPAPASSKGAHDETFFGFGTAPKPTWTQVHQTHFGFNADGSPKMAPAMAPAAAAKIAPAAKPAPAAKMGRRLLQGSAGTETFLPPIGTFYGTAPKPSLDTIHKAIFGFNAEGSKLMPEAMAPAPAAKAATMGRRLQQTAHDETFFPTGGPYYSGTAPKPSMGDMHKAIFGFNNDQASSETFYQGTFPKPSMSDVHRAIFGFNNENSKAMPEALAEGAKAPAPAH